MSVNSQPTDADVALFGNRFAIQEVPSREFPETGMSRSGRFAAGVGRIWRWRVIRPGTWRPS